MTKFVSLLGGLMKSRYSVNKYCWGYKWPWFKIFPTISPSPPITPSLNIIGDMTVLFEPNKMEPRFDVKQLSSKEFIPVPTVIMHSCLLFYRQDNIMTQ